VGADKDARRGDWLVLGGDVGGTSTRILVAGRDGTPVARATTGGGNPVSHPDTAAAALGDALRAALADVDPARIRVAVVGLAGSSALDQPHVRAAFERAWTGARVTCTPTYVSDLAVAFAGGTPEPDGTVLVAGTGAVAGAVRDRRVVRTADGHGWLLGDDGSGFWLGREAARATLRALDEDEPPGPLAAAVLRELGAEEAAAASGAPERRAMVIQTVHSRPPVRLADLAPLVGAGCDAGDPMAQRIADDAARLLTGTVGRVRPDEESTPIVLAGGLARADGPVGARLRELVRARFAGDVVSAADGVAGAAWLALQAAGPESATDAARRRLIAASSPAARRG
jgi:N-acetylglucosamine kinase-like BadF-type ATPase